MKKINKIIRRIVLILILVIVILLIIGGIKAFFNGQEPFYMSAGNTSEPQSIVYGLEALEIYFKGLLAIFVGLLIITLPILIVILIIIGIILIILKNRKR